MEKSSLDEPNAASPLVDQPPPYSAEAPAGPQTTVYQSAPITGQPAPMTGQSATVTIQPAPIFVQPANTSNVVVVAATACPACRAGVLQSEFTLCGICLGIWFFPLGLICCFLMRETRCSNCRASYS
ncbi:membrane protein BRI3 [Cherax quadricarinatus]|uniref:membrane protein BRI3 n=1 Tax=Cherax quadricarinatus TaxID=27406 RepID=UPI002379D0D1|nr:brain protein I3-like [Cherax quadricarinatus]